LLTELRRKLEIRSVRCGESEVIYNSFCFQFYMRNHSGTAIELWEEKGSYRYKQQWPTTDCGQVATPEIESATQGITPTCHQEDTGTTEDIGPRRTTREPSLSDSRKLTKKEPLVSEWYNE